MRHVLVSVEHHLAAGKGEPQADRDQLGVVQLVDIGSQGPGGAPDQMRRTQHAFAPAGRAPDIDDPHAVAAGVTETVSHYQGELMPVAGEAPALFDEDPGIESRMCRAQVHDAGHVSSRTNNVRRRRGWR